MSSFNKITIVGYLGRDPEFRYTPQGVALCNMSIATTERRKNLTGETEEHTTWFRVTAWRRQAELANEYLTKGRQVYVEGRLRLEEYTDRDGQKRISAVVSLTEMQFLSAGQGTNRHHTHHYIDGVTDSSHGEGTPFPVIVDPQQTGPNANIALEEGTTVDSASAYVEEAAAYTDRHTVIEDEAPVTTNEQIACITAEEAVETPPTTEGLVSVEVTNELQPDETESGTAQTASVFSGESVTDPNPEAAYTEHQAEATTAPLTSTDDQQEPNDTASSTERKGRGKKVKTKKTASGGRGGKDKIKKTAGVTS